ncbi:Acetate kinase [Nymphon striatum]|nr:Acetate kinase [Nymphon striatum]
MKILVLNAGSSSIKYQLFEMETESVLAKGLIDCIGENESHLKHFWLDENNEKHDAQVSASIPNHKLGLEQIVQQLHTSNVLKNPESLSAIGHRVVHGGNLFQAPVLIDQHVMQSIKSMIPLAPLHNPANVEGIEVARKLLPNTPQVAVFDTAFHQTMPPEAYRYAIPEEWHADYHVRRYGFHGTSHQCVAEQAATLLKRDLTELNLISLHLGNGCSATAIANGKSVDTSMGMTPLEGLVMGTRSGDIDPALLFYIHREAKLELDEIDSLLNKESGLKGLSGISDMREIEKLACTGDKAAQLAEATFVYRIRKYIGAYAAILGHVDALIFTGGIGENSNHIREKICHNLGILGIHLDKERNLSAFREQRKKRASSRKQPCKNPHDTYQ